MYVHTTTRAHQPCSMLAHKAIEPSERHGLASVVRANREISRFHEPSVNPILVVRSIEQISAGALFIFSCGCIYSDTYNICVCRTGGNLLRAERYRSYWAGIYMYTHRIIMLYSYHYCTHSLSHTHTHTPRRSGWIGEMHYVYYTHMHTHMYTPTGSSRKIETTVFDPSSQFLSNISRHA